jgi:lauroyl/myristoyl acyltransferase
MWLTDLISSRMGPFIGLLLVRILPRKAAYCVGDWVVRILVSRRDSQLYRSVRANQSVVRDWPYEDERLHAVVEDVLIHAAYGLVDWFHSIAFPAQLENLPCSIDDHLIRDVSQSQAQGRGVIIVGAHLSGFNMFFMMIARNNWPVQILSYYAEEGSYQSDNIFRKRFGLNVTPISPASLRQAVQRLKSGGCVLTGIDRPDTGGELLTFFGRPTRLPIGHTRLALRTGASIMIVAVQKGQPGAYHVVGSGLIEIEHHEDEHMHARALAQRVLDQMESYIRERPSEWMMFIPVWPDVLQEGS